MTSRLQRHLIQAMLFLKFQMTSKLRKLLIIQSKRTTAILPVKATSLQNQTKAQAVKLFQTAVSHLKIIIWLTLTTHSRPATIWRLTSQQAAVNLNTQQTGNSLTTEWVQQSAVVQLRTRNSSSLTRLMIVLMLSSSLTIPTR